MCTFHAVEVEQRRFFLFRHCACGRRGQIEVGFEAKKLWAWNIFEREEGGLLKV